MDTDLFNQVANQPLTSESLFLVYKWCCSKASNAKFSWELEPELSQYQEANEHFTRFGTAEVDESTRRQIEKGQRILSVLKQKT